MSLHTQTIPEQLRTALEALGWKRDTYGHMQRRVETKVTTPQASALYRVPIGETVKRTYRVKLQSNSVRYEVQGEKQSDGRKPWFRIAGGYLRDCKVMPDGRVVLGSKVIGGSK